MIGGGSLIGPKNGAPRAAQPAGWRTTRGDSFEEDPPSIDHPGLPFVPTNVIARRSLRSGGRFRVSAPSPRRTGTTARMATRFPSPVARLGSASRRTTLSPTPLPPRGPRTLPLGPHPAGKAFRSLQACARCPGWRALTGVNDTLPEPFQQVKRHFLNPQGCPPKKRTVPRISSSVHCPSTPLCTDSGRSCGISTASTLTERPCPTTMGAVPSTNHLRDIIIIR